MNDKKVYSKVRERIALENFKIERKNEQKRNKMIVIAAGTATAILAGFIAVKTMKGKEKSK